MERVVRREYTPTGETITTERLRMPGKKPTGSWLRVLIWQVVMSLLLCLGAWGLGRLAPERAAQVKSVLASQEEDSVSRALRCFWQEVADGTPVKEAAAEFYAEITDLS